MYTLRQYQSEARDAAVAFLQDGRSKNGLVVLPTGAGKSVCWAAIAEKLDARFLLFQPSKEILEQNLSKFHSFGYRPGVYSASMGRKSVNQITLATIGSVKNKAHLFSDFDFIGVDECDLTNAKKGQYKNFFDDIALPMIGMTATPYRLSSDSWGTILKFLTRTRPRIWHELIYYAQNKDLFDEGFLSPLEYQTVKGFDRHKLRANSTGADYTDQSVQMHMYEINFKDKIVKVVERLIAAERKNALVFTRFVEEAQYVVSKTPNSAIVTADTHRDERAAIGAEFKAGNIKVVCNVGIYSVGFDYPELDTVVLARPTMSLRLYYQQVGRCIRPHPAKASAWVVDMVGLTETFGKIEDLTIVDGGNGKWFIASGDRPLTNVYLNNTGGSRCRECGMAIGFWARHERTGNAAPIQRPPAGIPANIAIHSKDGKTLYSVVKPGEGEFLVHYSVCGRQQQMRATA